MQVRPTNYWNSLSALREEESGVGNQRRLTIAQMVKPLWFVTGIRPSDGAEFPIAQVGVKTGLLFLIAFTTRKRAQAFMEGLHQLAREYAVYDQIMRATVWDFDCEDVILILDPTPQQMQAKTKGGVRWECRCIRLEGQGRAFWWEEDPLETSPDLRPPSSRRLELI